MWFFCVLPVLLLLMGTSIADASTAEITAFWSYEIGQANGDLVKNAGSLQGFGELLGPLPGQQNPFVSFDITAGDVHLAAGFNPQEVGNSCGVHSFSFSFDDRTAAISGSTPPGGGCSFSTGFEQAFFSGRALDFGSGNLDVSLSGATSDITSAVIDIFGTAVVPVSEPADLAFLALCVGLVSLCIRNKQRA